MALPLKTHTVALHSLPVVRIARRGDRHQVHDLAVDILLEVVATDPATAPDTDALARAVYALAAQHGGAEPETFAAMIAQHALGRIEHVQRATVEVREHRWQRLDIGGRTRDRDLIGASGEVRVARAIATTERATISAGLRALQLLSSDVAGLEPLMLLSIDAVWTYGWAEIPYDTQWQQVRRALIEAYLERAHSAGTQLARALAHAVLEEAPAVRRVEMKLATTRRRAIDMNEFGMENLGEVFGAIDASRGIHEIVVERDEIAE